MIKTIVYIVLSGVVGWWLLYNADIRELNTSRVYDGCYEQYSNNNISPEDFTKFMIDCMK